MRKSDLVSCKALQIRGEISEIYLNTYFQRARLGRWLICEIGLYVSIYSNTNGNQISGCVCKAPEQILNAYVKLKGKLWTHMYSSRANCGCICKAQE